MSIGGYIVIVEDPLSEPDRLRSGSARLVSSDGCITWKVLLHGDLGDWRGDMGEKPITGRVGAKSSGSSVSERSRLSTYTLARRI
jgi:hypothetical protein